MKQALDYLRELGHSRIGFIGPKRLGDETKRIVREPRRRYYEHYMRERGLFRPDLVIEAPMRDQMIVENEFSMRLRAMERDSAPTAIVTVNEECAIGAIHALRKLQVQVPTDMSIVSFNDTVMSSVVEPPLTSVSPHLDYMAATAVHLVMQRASTPAHRPERRYPQKIVIPPALVRRSSTAPYIEKE